jgi:alpha-glucosidase
MDFIPNHTSDKHEWFIKSCNNDPKYRDYYVWYPSEDKVNPPNNWVNIVGYSAWTYNEKRKAWFYHTFLPEQPDLNMRSPAVREEMRKVIRFWLEEKKVDGLRIDAVKHLFEDTDFKDEPLAKHSIQVEADVSIFYR